MSDEHERRSSRRRRTFLKGQLVFNNNSSVLDCIVKDLSDAGAAVSFDGVFNLPQEFELLISTRDVQVSAHLVWSRGTTHGIAFTAGTVAPRNSSGTVGG
ncbi:PilZ domain-containing protein [Microvirga sp. VF16]|uniref:PilZ domain-containing protein n=1 Tax=Microvirga sp. VF16 TaxID=2807101 RepID=UPI00193DB4CB|nr:PilZ domain-containing protein [Microvirga sp. VF16]